MTPPSERTAPVNEMFVSWQGEGPYVGCRQVFVRFAGCNLHCGYCDTDHSEKSRVSVAGIMDFIRQAGAIHSVSLTGGEPLMHADFLTGLLPALKQAGHTTYLETNGVLAEELEKVTEWLDLVAMDIKIPSVAGDAFLFSAHKLFHDRLLRAGVEFFCKLVVSADLDIADLGRVAEICSPAVPLVLQPVHGYHDSPALKDNLIRWYGDLTARGYLVRVIPQVHKMMGIQ